MDTSFWARTDSNSANNPALNLNGDPALEIEFVWSSPTSEGGDVILEQNGGLPDATSQVRIGGVDYSFTFQYTGTLPTVKKNGSQQVPDELEGEPIYLITVHDYPGVGEDTRFAFLPDPTVTEAQMNDFGKGAIDIQTLDTTPPATPVCFVRGTLIKTPEGEKAVEGLQAGDQVVTAKGDTVTLQWIAHSHFTRADMILNPNTRPVCIPAGHLAKGLPHRDLWVSPQHRVVVRGWHVELALGEPEVLVAAKHLMTTPAPLGKWESGVDYFHLLLDQHDILVSNGVESESMLLGDEALRSMSPSSRHSLEDYMIAHPTSLALTQTPAMGIAKATEAAIIRPDFQSPKFAA